MLQQNPTLIHLRHVKSVVSRAARKVPHCQKWDCHALPLFALDRAFSRLFSMSILIAGKTKNGRAKSTRWSVWQPCFSGCDMTLGTPPAASKVHQKQWNQKGKTGIKQIEQFNGIILRILRNIWVTKAGTFSQWGLSRCTDSALLRQDSATKDIKIGTKLWCAGVMKSKLFPPMWIEVSSRFNYIILFFNGMILKSGRRTQSDPAKLPGQESSTAIFFFPSPLPFGGSTVLSLTRGPAWNRTTTGSLSATEECRDTNWATRTTIRGRKGEAQKETTHQETKTKLSSATPNHDKTINCQGKTMLRKPATTTPKTIPTIWQRLTTCSLGPDGAGDLQSATVFPGIRRSVGDVTAEHLGFSDSRSGPPQSAHHRPPKINFFLSEPVAFRRVCLWILLADQRNQPYPAIYQRHMCSAVPTAPRGRVDPPKGNGIGQTNSPPQSGLALMSTLAQRHRGHYQLRTRVLSMACRQQSILAFLCLGRQEWLQSRAMCFRRQRCGLPSAAFRNHKTIKGKKDDTNIHVLNWRSFRSPHCTPFEKIHQVFWIFEIETLPCKQRYRFASWNFFENKVFHFLHGGFS